MARNDTLAEDLLPWHHDNVGEPLVRPGDPVATCQWLAAPLRLQAHALSNGADFSRLDEHPSLDYPAAALPQGRLYAGTAAPPALRNLSVVASPARAPAPTPAPTSVNRGFRAGWTATACTVT